MEPNEEYMRAMLKLDKEVKELDQAMDDFEV
jgi:hypothetical protein